MAVNLVRFTSATGPRWGVVRGRAVVPLGGDYPTTAALIEYGESDWRNAEGSSITLDTLELLSPVTTPCRIFCQGANYRQHMIESGLDPDAKTFNMFFTKSDASVGLRSAPCSVRRMLRCSTMRSNWRWCFAGRSSRRLPSRAKH